MSEILGNKPDSPQERQRAEADIASSLSAGARALDVRAAANYIPEIDSDSMEGHVLLASLPDGFHRSRSFAKHAMFVVKDGAKTHEILFRDPMEPMSREQPTASKPETALSKFPEETSSAIDQNEDQQIIFTGTTITVTSERLISAKSLYSIRDGKNWRSDSTPLSPEQIIAESADVLNVVVQALEERILSQA